MRFKNLHVVSITVLQSEFFVLVNIGRTFFLPGVYQSVFLRP
jgi:hypothetical protein